MRSALKTKGLLDESQRDSSNADISIADTSCESDSESEGSDNDEVIVTIAGPGQKNEQSNVSQHGLTVIGLYGRAPIPRSEQLPENYTVKDMAADQFMPRRRLNTKPLYEDFDNSIMSDDNDDGDGNDNPFDEAMFVPVHGLVNHTFWHMNPNNIGYLYGERAILFQAMEHYDKLAQEPRFASCFDDYLTSPYFGEQVIVKGYDSSQLAVGDVFEVENDLSPLVVEITSPRKPCYYVNKRNGTSMGPQGMTRHTLTEGLAGWFARVVVAGELRDGMKLVRTKQPNPKWTLTYLSTVLYGEGNKTASLACKASWGREKEELVELLNLPQLGEFEWKDEARVILRKMEEEGTANLKLSITVKGIYGREDIPGYNLLPQNYTISDLEKDQLMPRYKYLTKPLSEEPSEIDDAKYDYAFFVKNYGLKGKWTDFWHTAYKETGHVYGDRAVLFQSVEHYNKIANHPKFASCFDGGKYDYISNPTFGEQVIVEGCDSSQIAVGDVFEVEGKKSPLVVEISAPRKPGYYLDKKHGTSFGENGIKRHCLTNGLSGWFTRVLVAGELRDGMKLVRTKHPNPKWTLAYLCQTLYSEGDIETTNRCQAHWMRSKDELKELVNLPQLGEVQWKDEGKKVLKKMEIDSRTEDSICRTFFRSIFSCLTKERSSL